MTAPPHANSEPWVLLARIVRPQGRLGEVLADLLTDFPERLAARKHLVLLPATGKPREVTLEKHWLHKNRIVLKFAGVDSISDAETLRGMELAVSREGRAALTGDEVYIGDLIGCRIFDAGSGEEIGAIAHVETQPETAALLVVERKDGEVLIPFARAYLKRLDVDAKRVEMALPEGLLEINAPLTDEEREAQKRAAAEEP